MTDTALHIWTDGACKYNPGPGGWGVYMQYGERTLELCGGEPQTTNNRMELTAAIQALKAVKRPCPIVFHVDSSYVKDGITQWIHAWKAKGWKNSKREPVKNGPLANTRCPHRPLYRHVGLGQGTQRGSGQRKGRCACQQGRCPLFGN